MLYYTCYEVYFHPHLADANLGIRLTGTTSATVIGTRQEFPPF